MLIPFSEKPSDLPPVLRRVKPALGTFFEIRISGGSAEEKERESNRAFLEVARLEKIFNAHDPDSELSRLNDPNRTSVHILSPDLAKVIEFAEDLEERSEKAFRLRDPENSRIDLSGIAKGYIVDCIYSLLRENENFLEVFVDAGGDGRSSSPLILEIRIPTLHGEKRMQRPMRAGAYATSSLLGEHNASGTPAARYSEKTALGAPVTVCVLAETCRDADAFTKIALFSNFQPFGTSTVLKFNREGELL